MKIPKTSGRGLYLSKTDEATQAIAGSSSEYVLAFPIKSQPRPLAFSLRGNGLVVGSISFLSWYEFLCFCFLPMQEMKLPSQRSGQVKQNHKGIL